MTNFINAANTVERKILLTLTFGNTLETYEASDIFNNIFKPIENLSKDLYDRVFEQPCQFGSENVIVCSEPQAIEILNEIIPMYQSWYKHEAELLEKHKAMEADLTVSEDELNDILFEAYISKDSPFEYGSEVYNPHSFDLREKSLGQFDKWISELVQLKGKVIGLSFE